MLSVKVVDEMICREDKTFFLREIYSVSNFGTGVPASISKPTPFIYLAFWPLKKRTHSYTWSSKMLTYSYTALWFLNPVITQISQSIHVIPRRLAASKNLWAKNMCIYEDVRKMGPLHIGIQKNRAIHILFVEKRGPIIYLAVLKKGAIRHAHPYYAIYRKLPPPPPRGLHSVN